jgi:hypothetical protein
MDMKTLAQIAKEIVTQSDIRNPTFDTVCPYMRQQLIDAALEGRALKAVNKKVITEINDVLGDAVLNLAMRRQFYDDAQYEAEIMLREDAAQRARDMRLEARGY